MLVDGCRSDAEVTVVPPPLRRPLRPRDLLRPRDPLRPADEAGRGDDGQTLQEFFDRDRRELKWGIGNAFALADGMLINEGSLEEFRRTARPCSSRSCGATRTDRARRALPGRPPPERAETAATTPSNRSRSTTSAIRAVPGPEGPRRSGDRGRPGPWRAGPTRRSWRVRAPQVTANSSAVGGLRGATGQLAFAQGPAHELDVADVVGEHERVRLVGGVDRLDRYLAGRAPGEDRGVRGVRHPDVAELRERRGPRRPRSG